MGNDDGYIFGDRAPEEAESELDITPPKGKAARIVEARKECATSAEANALALTLTRLGMVVWIKPDCGEGEDSGG